MWRAHAAYVVAALLFAAGLSQAHAQTIVLYGNDFESPNMPAVVDCGLTLDRQRGINFLYGTDEFVFDQQFTVEAVHLQSDIYSGNDDNHGNLAIGMLSEVEDDKLALSFDSQGQRFLNVGLDLSSIDVMGCGGSFGVDTPQLKATVLDTPGGEFLWDETYNVLDEVILEGVAAPDAWTFAWENIVVGLDTSMSTDGHITLVFDLVQSGYAVFDNLTITASEEEGVVDTDLDGVVDDQDQAPTDPDVCGDQNNDGEDDCDPGDVSAGGGDGGTGSGGGGSMSEPDGGGTTSEVNVKKSGGCNCAVAGSEFGLGSIDPWLLGAFALLRSRRRFARVRPSDQS